MVGVPSTAPIGLGGYAVFLSFLWTDEYTLAASGRFK